MRKVFSSQRLETVEGVADLLRRNGIEVRISNPRSYKGGRMREFSFLERPKEAELSAVWIVQVDQQAQARALLREAGLLDTTRPGATADADSAPDSYLGRHYGYGPDPDAQRGTAASPGRSWTWRIRIGLLVLIAGAVMFVSTRHRNAPAPATAPAIQSVDDDEVRVRVQPATERPNE